MFIFLLIFYSMGNFKILCIKFESIPNFHTIYTEKGKKEKTNQRTFYENKYFCLIKGLLYDIVYIYEQQKKTFYATHKRIVFFSISQDQEAIWSFHFILYLYICFHAVCIYHFSNIFFSCFLHLFYKQ